MAGVYAILKHGTEARLAAVADRLRYGEESQRQSVSDFSYVWLGHDDPERFSPAHDPSTGVRVVVAGRLVWPAEEWTKASRLPYEGGTANRTLLKRYLNSGPDAVTPYNGAATVIIWDPRDRSVHLWTDQMGYHPSFVYRPNDPDACVITTFPDAILADGEAPVEPDLTSMAEFLRAWRVTPPHTYYREVVYAGAATHWRWSLNTGSATQRVYWTPFKDSFFSSLPEAADCLAHAVTEAIHERTSNADERPTFFVSGGADSRVLLFAAAHPAAVTGINLYERPTFEASIAQTLCQRAGAQYVGYQRDNDYYPRLLRENVRWSGAMWSAEDSHYLGVHGIVTNADSTVVMTACTTDWVFKGYGLEKAHRRLFGRNLPLKTYLNERVDGFLPNYPRPAPPDHAAKIEQRMASWFAHTPQHLCSEQDRLFVEDRRVRPACYTVSVSGQLMYRVYPYDTFLADSRIAECYSRTLPKWKLNGEVWGRAAAQICHRAGKIVDANWGWTIDATVGQKLAAFAQGWIRRRLPRPAGPSANGDDHPPSSASWPDLGWYAIHSGKLYDFWHSVPVDHRQRMASLWGADPWATPLEQWSRTPCDLFRIVTLLAHWQVAVTRDPPVPSAGSREKTPV